MPGEWRLIESPSDLTEESIQEWKPEKIFFLDWSWKVPTGITETVECIAFHPTDLPYGRGGSPYQNLIMNRMNKSVLSAFRLTDEIDAGPVYLKKSIKLDGRAEEIMETAGRTALEMIQEILQGEIVPLPQSGEVVSFKRRKGSDNQIPEDLKDMRSLYDFLRMLDAPTYPNGYLDIGIFRILFEQVSLEDGKIEARAKIIERP
ncbi:MAG: methionyl-tRNA formyltransferase [Nitrospinaceae bacterium]|nr:methionyl-tRNA formyltransferase [Nitrospinaceae bacterium]MBT5369753.1 methionyl-tRNA formyltransferase [Nitrospinaceae bacterium]MBT6395750.1 methionyl-tRNA formyltransferase [Nitrospinaceae bacterium]